jgi:hypothetical protein
MKVRSILATVLVLLGLGLLYYPPSLLRAGEIKNSRRTIDLRGREISSIFDGIEANPRSAGESSRSAGHSRELAYAVAKSASSRGCHLREASLRVSAMPQEPPPCQGHYMEPMPISCGSECNDVYVTEYFSNPDFPYALGFRQYNFDGCDSCDTPYEQGCSNPN